jgi:serine/threonine protein kinase
MGEVFAGRYELADPIGRGGVGAVWRAWDHRRRRYVAAKVLQQRDAHSLLRFVREQALRIDHPHVLAPASWAADDDKVLFTMDLVAGGSLVHLVNDYGPLPPAYVCTLLDQLLSGLAAVHAEGVVHRDIKPANILLEATGTARPHLRLSDFGIAMRLGEPRLTDTNLVVGTPGYLAPEQMLGAEPDFPADLFAVGLVALYLLQGAKPDSRALVEYFAEHGTPGAPRGVPAPLWEVVATLLQPDPDARFRTATGARKALAAAAELLPEPGPDDELIEVFDQLGPLPPGFGPDGPLRPGTGAEVPDVGTAPEGAKAEPEAGAEASVQAVWGARSAPGSELTGPGSAAGPASGAATGPAAGPATGSAAGPATGSATGSAAVSGGSATGGGVTSGAGTNGSSPRTPATGTTGGQESTGTPEPTPTPTSSTSSAPSTMSDTGSFHLPPPQPYATGDHPTQPLTPVRHRPAPAPTPPPAPGLAPLPTHTSTASYTAQVPLVPPTARHPETAPAGHARRRPGPPASVALPLLLLALACYAVGFWALTQL